jgi:hypothetical protein
MFMRFKGTMDAGEKFCFADMLDDTLIAQREQEKRLKLWSLVYSAAVSANLGPASAPRFEEMFGHVARKQAEAAMGHAEEGLTHLEPRPAIGSDDGERPVT